MDARLYRPPADHPLAPYLIGIFRVRCVAGAWEETILPKGNVDLIFNLGSTMTSCGPGGVREVAEGAVWIGGLRTLPYRVHAAAGMLLLGISLRAETAGALLPFPPGDLLNQEVEDPGCGLEMAVMRDRLAEAPDFAAQCAMLLQWLSGRLNPPRGAALVRSACARLRAAATEDAVSTASRTLGVSTRHLRRLLNEQLGVGASEYVRLSRFTRTLPLLRSTDWSVSRVAQESGYYDQAHFAREFRRFSGLTALQYRAAPPHVSPGHIVRSVRSVQEPPGGRP
jgi:AraC-like DNA-binding protein